MECIKTKNYNTMLDVYCDGNYYFVDSWNGLCAVARRNIDRNNGRHFDVELTIAIDQETVMNIINKHESSCYLGKVTYEFSYPMGRSVSCSLKYGIRIELV
jgi:hypothetical protein